MSYHYNVYLLCYSKHVGHSSHVQSILAIVRPILVCQDIVAGQQRILIISSAYVSQVGTLNRVTVNYMTSAIRRALKVTLVPRQHICACLKLPQ